MTKLEELEQIKADILSKNICPDLAKQATRLVMGEGSENATVFMIGEAPGKKEDETGLPFIGAAGRFLDDMLAAAGMVRNDIFITSIVKYRPPKNRDPTSEEKEAFWPYLLKQIQVIQPKVIVTLGRHSMEYFLPGMKISEIHGEPKRITFGDDSIVVIPLYHPAAALYNGSLRQILIDDFMKVPPVLEQL